MNIPALHSSSPVLWTVTVIFIVLTFPAVLWFAFGFIRLCRSLERPAFPAPFVGMLVSLPVNAVAVLVPGIPFDGLVGATSGGAAIIFTGWFLVRERRAARAWRREREAVAAGQIALAQALLQRVDRQIENHQRQMEDNQ